MLDWQATDGKASRKTSFFARRALTKLRYHKDGVYACEPQEKPTNRRRNLNKNAVMHSACLLPFFVFFSVRVRIFVLAPLPTSRQTDCCCLCSLSRIQMSLQRPPSKGTASGTDPYCWIVVPRTTAPTKMARKLKPSTAPSNPAGPAGRPVPVRIFFTMDQPAIPTTTR